VTPTKHVHCLGIFDERTNKEHKREANGWERTSTVGVGMSTSGNDGDMRAQEGAHPSSLAKNDEEFCCVWERAGKFWSTTKYPSFLGRTPGRFDNPIDTPMESHYNRHKERGALPTMGRMSPEVATVEGRTDSFRRTGSTKGRDGSVE
jgi:hypothetical protein